MPVGHRPESLLAPVQDPSGGPAAGAHRTSPTRHAGAFLAVGLAWIWLMDFALGWSGIRDERGFWEATGNSFLILLQSAYLLYWLIHRESQGVARESALLLAVPEGASDRVFVRGVLDSMAAQIAVLDRNGVIVVVNRAWREFALANSAPSGPHPRAGVGTNYLAVCDAIRASDGDEIAAVAAGIRRVIAGTLDQFVLEYPGHTEEKQRWFSLTVTPLEHASTGVVVAHADISERKLAEDDVRRSREMLRLVLDNIPQGVFWKDAGGRFQGCNRVAARTMGLDGPDAIVGRLDADLPDLGPDDAAYLAEQDLEVIHSGVAQLHLQYTRSKADGRTIHVSANKVPFHDSQGRVLGMLTTWEDVTERRQAEEALRNERDRFARIAAIAPGVIYSFRVRKDGKTSMPYASPAITALYGLRPEEIEDDASAVLGMLHPGDVERILASIDQSARSLTPWRETYRIRRPDLGEIWIEGHSMPVREPDESTLWVGFLTDITERKRHEEVLRFQNALLSSQAEASPDGILVVDPEQRVRSHNRRFLDLWGIPAEVLAAGDDSPVLAVARSQAADPDGFAKRVEAIYADPDMTTQDEVALTDGRTLERYSGPIIGAEGERFGRVWFFRDITQRKQAEAALRESETRFRNVFEHAATGIVVTDAAGRFLRCNPAYCALLGQTEDELLAASLPELIHPDDRDENMNLLRGTAAGEIPGYELENRFIHKSGRPVWVHKVVSALRDEEGRTTHLMALVTDVTERHRAEQALRESEERYRRVVDVLPAAVFVHTSSEIVFCNPAFVRLLGASHSQELLGRNPFDVLHSDYYELVRTRIVAVCEAGESSTGIEMRVLRIDGRTVLVDCSATPISGYGPSAILVALTDLSERERSSALLRSVLANVNDAILTIDARGTVRSANPATHRLFGYSEAELVGGNVRILMPEPYQSEHDAYIGNYLHTGVAKVIGIGREVIGRRKDGTTFPLELTVNEFRFDGEQRFTGVIRDITARRRLEAQFQQAQKMEAVGRLAGGVAHDFNNLLTVINGYSDLVLMALSPDDFRREQVAAIREAGERAARLTQQLLAFSRKAVLEPKVLDLNELVAESAKLLRRLIGEDIVLAVIPDPAPVKVKADRGQLEQVVMNLAVNARDAMPSGGRLTIETRNVAIGDDDLPAYPDLKTGRYARLSVSDTGLGMTDEVKIKIFEPFFTTKGVGQGTGLGLAVVHGVVEQCGGQIEFDSTLGIGTTFSLYFPVVAEGDAKRASSIQSIDARGVETVLLVEDEDAVRTVARISLESQGYKVLEAGSGVEALQMAEAYPDPIHLLLSDVVMPEMGGRQLVEAVRKSRPLVRLLYMSGYTDDEVVHHGVESARDAFIQKPFTPLGLARKVRAVLDGS